MSLLHLTNNNFKKEVLDSDRMVVVDFWAEWCGPCRMIAPIIEELAKEFLGRVKIGKLNVDESPGIATRYGIMSIPTVMFFKNGKVMEHAVGVLNKAQFKKKIEENI